MIAASCASDAATWPEVVLGASMVVAFCFLMWLLLK